MAHNSTTDRLDAYRQTRRYLVACCLHHRGANVRTYLRRAQFAMIEARNVLTGEVTR